MKLFYYVVLFCLLTTVVSCGNDDDGGPGVGCNSIALNERFADEITAVSNASSAYAMDPTPANCQSFKDAYNDYINALDAYENCAVTLNQRAEWEQALDAARSSLNSIVC